MTAAVDPAPSALRVFASIGRLHVVAVAALGTLTFGWVFTGKYPWFLSAVCALDWLIVNVSNRVVDLAEDRANGVIGTELVARHAVLLRVLTFAVFLASLVLVHRVVPAVTVVRVGFHGLGLVYNRPLLPGHVRLKQLYMLKNATPAMGFLLSCLAYPIAGAHGQLAPGVSVGTVLVTALFLFLFELSYEVIYDLRDAPGDEEAGVSTYAVVHGPLGAVRIIDGLCVASAITLVTGFALKIVPWRVVVMTLAPAAQALLYRRWLRRGLRAEDCVRLTWLGAALFVVYDAWVSFGLPGSHN